MRLTPSTPWSVNRRHHARTESSVVAQRRALYRYFGYRAGLHRALIGRWVSRALSDFRADVLAGPPGPETIEHGFRTYLGVLERERSTYFALAQLGHVSGATACGCSSRQPRVAVSCAQPEPGQVSAVKANAEPHLARCAR